MKNPKHILLVKNRAMGDAIMGLSTLQYLKELYPDCKISYAIPSWIIPLFKHSTIAADHLFALDLISFRKASASFYELLRSDVDYIHECHLGGRSFKFFKTLSFLKNIPYSYHNHHLSSGPVIDQGKTKALIQRDLDGVFTFLGQGANRPNYLDYEPKMTMPRVNGQRKKIILGIVATRETKMWPTNFYNDLAGILNQELPDFDILVPLSSSVIDQSLKKFFTYRVRFIEKSLQDLPQELNGASLYVGNDTGLKHLCIALGIPSYTLFGPEPPLEWHPYDCDRHRFYFREPLPCRTQKYHYCPLTTCDSMICLNQFKANDVWNEIKSLIAPTVV